jgi:hypothetical protein
MIYFVKDTFTQAIKIGYSRKPTQRIGTIQTGNPHKLMLLGTVPGTPADEDSFHGKFAHHRLQGEWFNGEIIEEVLAIISEHKERREIKRNAMTDTNYEVKPEAMPELTGNEKAATDKDSGILGISRIPGLRMKSFSMKLTECPGAETHNKGQFICGVEIKYVLEFENDVTVDELPGLQMNLLNPNPSTRVRSFRHTFFDEDNAVIPFDVSEGSHIVGGRDGITGMKGDGFRVVIAFEKTLNPKHQTTKIKDVFTGENYAGEHPLKKARKLAVYIR